MSDCCNPCPTVQTVNIPGAQGNQGTAGTNGANGNNAYTSTITSSFVVPTGNNTIPTPASQVTIAVANNGWMMVGQNVFITGAGIFQVISTAGTTSAVVQYLAYNGNTHATATINPGAGVSPSGTQPAVTNLPTINVYAVGGSQVLPTPLASIGQLLSLTITLATPGTYLLMASFNLQFAIATFASSQQVIVKLRRTNNTPADVTSAIANLQTGTTSVDSGTFEEGMLPVVQYTASAGDIIQLYGAVANSPYSGSLQAVEGSIMAIPMF